MKKDAAETKAYIDAQQAEERKLLKIIQEADAERSRQKKQLDQVSFLILLIVGVFFSKKIIFDIFIQKNQNLVKKKNLKKSKSQTDYDFGFRIKSNKIKIKLLQYFVLLYNLKTLFKKKISELI